MWCQQMWCANPGFVRREARRGAQRTAGSTWCARCLLRPAVTGVTVVAADHPSPLPRGVAFFCRRSERQAIMGLSIVGTDSRTSRTAASRTGTTCGLFGFGSAPASLHRIAGSTTRRFGPFVRCDSWGRCGDCSTRRRVRRGHSAQEAALVCTPFQSQSKRGGVALDRSGGVYLAQVPGVGEARGADGEHPEGA